MAAVQMMAFAVKIGLPLVAVGLCYFFAQLYEVRMKTRRLTKDHGIPILPHSLIFGHMIALGKAMMRHPSDISYVMMPWALMQEYPEMCEPGLIYLDVWPISKPMLIAVDAEIAKQFCQEPSAPKHPLIREQMSLYSQQLDILSLEGEEWKIWRSIFNPCFSVKNILALLPAMIEEINLLKERLRKAAKSEEVIKLDNTTMITGFNVVIHALFGRRLAGPDESNRLYKVMKSQIGCMISSNEPRNLLKLISPVRQFVIWNNNRLMHNTLAPLVDELVRDADNAAGVKFNTITHQTIRAYNNGSFGKLGAQPKKFTASFLRQVIAHLKLFLFAGSDTTSTTLCFAWYHLSCHKEAMAKVRAEHDAVLGPDPSRAGEVLRATPSLINQLPYTAAVIKEVLRLNPPASSVRAGAPGRTIVHPVTNMHYPTDGWVLMSASHGVNNNPKYYDNPDKFNPDRWFGTDGNAVHAAKSTYRPFELGPRNCIGQELARTEMALILALTVREFDMEPAYPEDSPKVHGYQCYMSLMPNEYLSRPKSGLPVKVELRSQASDSKENDALVTE